MLVRAMARRLSSTGRLSCYERAVCSSYALRNASTTSTSIGTFSTTATPRTSSNEDPLLIAGSGVAGCAAALVAAEKHNLKVKLLFAGSLPQDCNSYWAQGGIIYRNFDKKSGDSAESLANDIFRAGAGLCAEDAVWKVATQGPDIVKQLLLDDSPQNVFANVPFDRDEDGNLSCCLEASHAAPRIIHYADHTGKLITQHIVAAAARHSNIELVPETLVTDLLVVDDKCVGVETLDRVTGEVGKITSARGTVLASGGLGGIYQHSTNPAGFNALGSSVALAERSFVETKDLEYVQFHPTSLYIPNEARFLLTEALRGEGAILRNASSKAFAREFHPDGELAPRDIVARGVFEESQKSGKVFLDITHRDRDWLHKRFPAIQAHLAKRGLDLAVDQLPVIPAAHYTCGGIATNLEGCTSLTNLYAAGEAARTGLHGGNRLASTSLLEGLVFGASVADHVGSEQGLEKYHEAKQVLKFSNLEKNNNSTATNLDKEAAAKRATALLQELRECMWDHVGVVRTPNGLDKAVCVLKDIQDEANMLFSHQKLVETAALRDAAYSGMAVAKAAYENRTSAGAHCILEEDSDSDEDDLAAAGAS